MTKPALSGHKRGSLFLAFLAIIAIAVPSCKKDLFDQSRKEYSNPELVKRNAEYRKGPQMEKLSFNAFRTKTDLNVLGSVGKMLATANPKAKTMAVNTPETYEGLQINTDSVTIIKNGDRTSYIFSIKLSNPRAIVFQNLTVDVSPERTLTFINTYAPTQKWIARWRSGNPGEFEGDISVTYLKSASTGLPGIGSASPDGGLNKNSPAKLMGGAVKPGTSGKTSMVYQDCYTTTYYYITPYTCTGDHHWPWEECRLEGDNRAGWRISSKDITDCYEYDDGIGSGGGYGGGSGGGGGTSPSTPPDYDPCDTTQPPTGPIGAVKSGATGAKLMVHQNPDCNPTPPPVMPSQAQQLINNLQIVNVRQINYLNDPANGTVVMELSDYLDAQNHTDDANNYARWAVAYLTANSPNINIFQFLAEFFPYGPSLTADPDADNWTDPDNVILYDPDQTVYPQYQDGQPWPTVNRDNVIPFEKFVPIRNVIGPDGNPVIGPDGRPKKVNCLVLAKEQLGKAGYTCSGWLPGSQTFSIYTAQTGVDMAKTKQAISYMISSLQQNIPVLIGVDNRPGAPAVNLDKTTDHYVVIVGMGTDEKGKYFQFVDSATSDRSEGASYSNRLYYNSTTGKISGRTAVVNYRNQAGMYDYIVTQVRKSIKK